MLERVALGFGEDVLVGAGKIVGGTEVEHGGAQHALVGAADLGGEDAGKDELALHFLVAQLDVEVVAGGASRVRHGRQAKSRADETEQRRNMPHVQSFPRKNARRAYGPAARSVKYAMLARICAPGRFVAHAYSGKMTGDGRCSRPGPGGL